LWRLVCSEILLTFAKSKERPYSKIGVTKRIKKKCYYERKHHVNVGMMGSRPISPKTTIKRLKCQIANSDLKKKTSLK
jgi:hypothetical protein